MGNREYKSYLKQKTARQINDAQTGEIEEGSIIFPPKKVRHAKMVTESSCQACLSAHDKEIKEALEKLGLLVEHSEQYKSWDGFYLGLEKWTKFWNERGVK